MTGSDEGVRFGLCTGPPGEEHATRFRAAGCDYYEPTVAKAIMAEDATEFAEHLGAWSAGGLAPRGANVLLPPEVRVVGESVDRGRVHDYLAEAMRRVEVLGIERVVFGSGASARAAPAGFSKDIARRQLCEAVVAACEAAGPSATVCLEHFRAAETNLVNRLGEAAEIVAELDLPNLALVADGYHLVEENEDLEVVTRVASRIAHVHVCGAGRRAPSSADEPQLVALFERLADAGYRGRCSIECNFEDLDKEAAPALEAVRSAAGKAGLV